MITSIVEIILGLFIWHVVPGWITEGNRKTRDFIRLACNIIGVIIVLAGAYSLLKVLI